MVRRLVAKTIAQQIRAPIEVATAPFQYALSTRAGYECVAHALQALTTQTSRATIWVLLLHCAAARPNYMLKMVHPALSAGFAGHHDATMRQALSQLVAAPPCNMLGCSKCSSDSLHMIQRRHPAVAGQILQELSQPHVVREELVRIGFVAPSWALLVGGLRFVILDPEDQQLACQAMGGSRQQQIPCTLTSWRARSDHDWERWSRHCCVLKAAHCLVSLSLVFLPARWHASVVSVVSGFLSLLLRAAAGVAVSWTSLATTVQFVRRLE